MERRKFGRTLEPSASEKENLIDECLEHIVPIAVKQAFRLFVERTRSQSKYVCFPYRKGYFVDFRFYRDEKWVYAFIVNKQSLLFYFRHPSFAKPENLTRHIVQTSFPEAFESPGGEIKFRVNYRSDAERVLQFLSI